MRINKIKSICESLNIPQYNQDRILKSIYQLNIQRWSDMTFLNKHHRDLFQQEMNGDSILTVEKSQETESKQCTKYLLKLQDQLTVESVWMKFQQSHSSVCISSQVGCALKCNFCATGTAGFQRQMTVDEIVDQVLFLKSEKQSMDTISFMGMGEALQNPKVFVALQHLTQLSQISPRRINVSTVGIIPGIVKLTKEFPNVNLAFSLHSPFDEQRSILIPANRLYPLHECLKVLKSHAMITKRRVFLAYLVLPGFNDTKEHANELLSIINEMGPVKGLFHLNLIRYNPAEGVNVDYKRTLPKDLKKFQSLLKKQVNVTIRQSFGLDIDAACGQLYRLYLKNMDKQRTVDRRKSVVKQKTADKQKSMGKPKSMDKQISCTGKV